MSQVLEYDPLVGFKYKKNLKTRVMHESGGYLVQTNAQGFRSHHDFLSPKSEAKQRVLVFGDSFTAGDGVSNTKRYTDVLEKKLTNLEVFNYGLPGTGTDQQYLTFHEIENKTDSDLIVISIQVENITRNLKKNWPWVVENEIKSVCKPYYTLESGELVLNHNPVPREIIEPNDQQDTKSYLVQTSKNLIKSMFWFYFNSRFYKPDLYPDYMNKKSKGWMLMESILKKWIREAEKPVLLFLIPNDVFIEEKMTPKYYQARFKELADDLGCFLHDPTSEILNLPMDQRIGFKFAKDVHPTPLYHDFLANSLVGYFRKHFPHLTGNNLTL